MKKPALPLAVAVAVACRLIGCSGESNESRDMDALLAFIVTNVNGNEGTCTELLAGQTIPAGTVCFEVIGDFLEVTYLVTDGSALTEAHLSVTCGPEEYPQTRKGNAIPGQFPYQSGDITGQTEYTFVIPLSDFTCLDDINCDPGNLLYIMAHAALDNGETAWADGDPTSGKNWATQCVVTVRDDSCDGVPRCFDGMSAYAFGEREGATCFLRIDEDGDGQGDFLRWGWTNLVSPGNYVWDLHAGSVNCDRNSGGIIGTVTVDYDGSTAVVRYDVTAPGWSMARTHLYVGGEILPRNAGGDFAATPQAYPYSTDHTDCVVSGNLVTCAALGALSATYVVEGLSGDINIIAHASSVLEIGCE